MGYVRKNHPSSPKPPLQPLSAVPARCLPAFQPLLFPPSWSPPCRAKSTAVSSDPSETLAHTTAAEGRPNCLSAERDRAHRPTPRSAMRRAPVPSRTPTRAAAVRDGDGGRAVRRGSQGWDDLGGLEDGNCSEICRPWDSKHELAAHPARIHQHFGLSLSML